MLLSGHWWRRAMRKRVVSGFMLAVLLGTMTAGLVATAAKAADFYAGNCHN